MHGQRRLMLLGMQAPTDERVGDTAVQLGPPPKWQPGVRHIASNGLAEPNSGAVASQECRQRCKLLTHIVVRRLKHLGKQVCLDGHAHD